MAFAKVNGLVLHYRLEGPDSAPTLVFVNSLGTDARIWDEVIERLSDDYRVVSYDKRGHGLSGAPEGDYTLDDQVGDLCALADHVGARTFALCGVSVGGIIAQGFALRHPDRLAGLILCDTAPNIGDPAMWSARIARVRSEGIDAIADGLMERWFTADYRNRYPAQVEGWRTMLTRMPPSGYIATCATLRDTDLWADVGQIRAPTIVIVGDQDLSTPAALVKQNADLIPGARFRQIASSGHLPSIDQPGPLAACIRSFLKEIGHG